MSKLTEWLKSQGVPKDLLDQGQRLIDGHKEQLAAQLPTAEAIAARIRGNPVFKKAYRALPAEQQLGVDAALLVIAACARETMRKELGL
jgi:hypothetical protein